MKYLAWLENEIAVKKRTDITEYSGGEVLEKFRSTGDKFMGLSFATISGMGTINIMSFLITPKGENGAITHYKAKEETAAKIHDGTIYLVDSGGQYLYF